MRRNCICIFFILASSQIVYTQDCLTNSELTIQPSHSSGNKNLITIAQFKYADTTAIDLKLLAVKLTEGINGSFQKVSQIIQWTNQNLHWNYTDYKSRTVKEILYQKGGNCAEQASVVRALLEEIGIKTRKAVEINIQPAKAERQKNAEDKVKEIGNRGSVFGLAHNDHVWIEFFDEEQKTWLPADATLGLVGLDDWLKARIGFQKRIVHDILPSADMLVPIAVLIMDTNRKIIDNRSGYYLIDSFDKIYQGKLSVLPSWSKWKKAIVFIQEKAMKAFQGEVNLHEYASQIKQVGEIYQALRKEYCASIQ